MNEQTATDVLTLIQSGGYDDALAVLEAQLRAEPEDWYAYYYVGLAFRGVKEFGSAIAAYSKSLELLPDDFTDARSNVLLGLGVAFQQKGQYESAVRCFDDVIRQSPEMITAHNSLGYTYRLMGRFDEALLIYDNAIDRLFITLYQTLDNSKRSPIFAAQNTRGMLWGKKAYKIAVYFASSNGVQQCSIPNDKMAANAETIQDYGGLYFVDNPGSSGIIRQLLPNYFNTVRELLRRDVLYATLANNQGGVSVELDRKDEAIASFVESIEFIPDGTSYPPPYLGLGQLGVDVGN